MPFRPGAFYAKGSGQGRLESRATGDNVVPIPCFFPGPTPGLPEAGFENQPGWHRDEGNGPVSSGGLLEKSNVDEEDLPNKTGVFLKTVEDKVKLYDGSTVDVPGKSRRELVCTFPGVVPDGEDRVSGALQSAGWELFL